MLAIDQLEMDYIRHRRAIFRFRYTHAKTLAYYFQIVLNNYQSSISTIHLVWFILCSYYSDIVLQEKEYLEWSTWALHFYVSLYYATEQFFYYSNRLYVKRGRCSTSFTWIDYYMNYKLFIFLFKKWRREKLTFRTYFCL